jgi:hypothetical protein
MDLLHLLHTQKTMKNQSGDGLKVEGPYNKWKILLGQNIEYTE